MKSVEEKKKERKLNKGQVAVLMLLYRYRFTTSELLAKAEDQKHLQVTRSRLATLEKQGYIHRLYDKSYKLRGKFAAYCLTAKGLSYLKSIDAAEPQIIKMMYNDPKASEKFIDFCLVVCRTAQALKVYYGEDAKTFTRNELVEYDYFPQPQPDLYLSIKRNDVRHYFVDLYDDVTPTFVLAKKMKKYAEHQASGEWDTTGSNYPEVVIVCLSSAGEKRLRKKLEQTTIGGLRVHTSLIGALETDSEDTPFTEV